MANRPKVDKQKFIEDIRGGLNREDLRSKYQMTLTAFQNLLSLLLEKGRITNDDIRDLIHTTYNSAHSQELSRRPEAGVHKSKESHSPGQENSPQVTAERLAAEDDFLRDPLLRLIAVVDQCNHAVKQGDWLQSDLDTFYQLKDAFMERIYRNPPMGVEVKLKLVPYLTRCSKCKDQAGNAMRSETNSDDFERYLEAIPPCGNDYEVAERATLEMEINYLGRIFCFHIPVQQVQGWGVDMTALERKAFIPAKEFNHMRFAPAFDEIRALMDAISSPEERRIMASSNGTHVGDAAGALSQERDYWYTWIDGFLIGPMSQQGLCDIIRSEADDSEDLRAIGPFSAEELRDMGLPESSLKKPILSWRPTPPEVGLSDIAGRGEIRGGGSQNRNPKVWKHARDIPFLSELIS